MASNMKVEAKTIDVQLISAFVTDAHIANAALQCDFAM